MPRSIPLIAIVWVCYALFTVWSRLTNPIQVSLEQGWFAGSFGTAVLLTILIPLMVRGKLGKPSESAAGSSRSEGTTGSSSETTATGGADAGADADGGGADGD